ncbi:outer dense fiber protein 3-like [Stegodyphus dumicola]|uniref:outer dense fiber protein 3-like n=1 Tax=Stegodyphus dumicola TaxID=202533 RepID=UPI0015AF37B0|nr:outer dense fiber protein 3-like [Stegodyphus dumicola]
MSDGRIQQNPGPAAYMLPSTDINMSKAPAYSISTKAVPPRGATWSPGPAAHSAHMVKYDKYSTPRITFGIKHSPFKALPGFDTQK